jgi:hypothetical protein
MPESPHFAAVIFPKNNSPAWLIKAYAQVGAQVQPCMEAGAVGIYFLQYQPNPCAALVFSLPPATKLPRAGFFPAECKYR